MDGRRRSVNVTRRRITGAPTRPGAKRASESFLAETSLRSACGTPPATPSRRFQVTAEEAARRRAGSKTFRAPAPRPPSGAVSTTAKAESALYGSPASREVPKLLNPAHLFQPSPAVAGIAATGVRVGWV